MTVPHTPGVMTTRPAWVGSTSVSTEVALRQRVQQCLRFLQVSGIEALGEPAVDWCQEVMGFLVFALLLPESTEADCRPQLPGLGLLGARHHERLVKRGFSGYWLVCKASQQQ